MTITKNGIIACLILLVLVLARIAYYQSDRADYHKGIANALENTISNTTQRMKTSEVKLSDSLVVMQAEVKDLEITCQNLRDIYGKMLKASNTKPKEVEHLTVVETLTQGKDTVWAEETFKGLTAIFSDKYINIKIDIDTVKRIAIDYLVRDSLTVINYQKKHSLFFGLIKWKSYEGCKVISGNPKSSPNSVISYSIIN